ncbi:hypothetical protein SEA_PAVLO_94 [Microbacterium phage Pavlo]|nr:hypothetical protein SEA_PAVLO_94 [Microbacterium phage Pavlo]
MSDRREALAEQLVDIDEAIRQLDMVIDNTGWVSTLKIAGDAKEDLLRERRETVEQLEALGLEDPAS